MAISPQEFAQLHANALQYVGQQKAQPKKGRSGLAKFAPAIGATIAGVAAAPFTGGLSLAGTLAALGAAGAVGSAAGELGAQKVSHEKTNVGNILKEGAIGGALSATPIGGLGRAAKTVGEQAAKTAVTNVAESAAGNVGKNILSKPTTYSKIASSVKNSGQRLESRAGGYGQGTKVAGQGRLTYSQVQKTKALDTAEKIPKGHPDVQGKVIEQRLANANKQLETALQTGNRRLGKGENIQLRGKLNSAINKNTAIKGNTQAQKRLAELNASWRNITTVKGAVKAKRDLQTLKNYARNSSAATPVAEQVNSAAIKTLDEFINSAHPAVGAANKRVSSLIQRLDLSGAESSALKQQANNAGGGVVGRLTTGDTATAAKSRLGNTLQKLPAGNTSGGQIASLGGGELAKQAIGRAFVPAGLGPTSAPQPQDNSGPSPLDSIINVPGATGPYNAQAGGVVAASPDALSAQNTGTQTDQTQSSPNPYPLEKALMDIQRDPKHADTYLSIYKTVAAAQTAADKAAKGGAAHGIVSAQSYSNAQSGEQSLKQLSDLISKNPNLTSKTTIPGQGLPVIGGYVQNALGTNQYKALAHNVADAVLRLRTGAQANESEIRLYMRDFLPQAGDNPQTVQQKLQILQSNFTPYTSQGGPTDASSLTDILSQLQGA